MVIRIFIDCCLLPYLHAISQVVWNGLEEYRQHWKPWSGRVQSLCSREEQKAAWHHSFLRHINSNFTLAECLRFLIHVRLYSSALFEMPAPWQAAVLVCSVVQVGCAVLSPPRLLGCLGWGYPDLVPQPLVITVIMDELSEEIQTVEPRQITFNANDQSLPTFSLLPIHH